MTMRVIGLISGTSVDGIDAAMVDITGTDLDIKVELIAGATYPYPDALREKILAVCGGAALSMAELAQLDDHIAQVFAEAALAIQANHAPAQLIGSHGQTVFHRPPNKQGRRVTEVQGSQEITHHLGSSTMGYSLQLGRGALITHLTGINTVSNFRAADIAVGGEGAPLVSRLDASLLSHPSQNRCVQNIGGIGNVTYLPARQGDWLESIRGWDTGPGNTLIDLAVQHLTSGTKTYDKDGAWAASGTPCLPLVEHWLQHEFFQQPPPKSTGRELFGVDFLHRCLADAQPYQLNAASLLATLTELTVVSIVHSYQNFLPNLPDQVLLCGGGSRNIYLKQRLQTYLSPVGDGISSFGDGEKQLSLIIKTQYPLLDRQSSIPVLTTDEIGLNADYKEAIAFAVLAYWRYFGHPGNLKQVTGAQNTIPLGDIHLMTQKLHTSIESGDRAVGNQGKE